MSAPVSRVPLAVVVLTWNEAKNLDACLASVDGWTQELFVVDSGSTDATLDIAARHGATVVTHAFESHAKQWRWAFEHLTVSSPWILAIDADQRVSDELRRTIETSLASTPAAIDGLFVARRQVFRGRWIRHGGYYPKFLLKLFRRRAVVIDDGDLVDHHFRVTGATARLAGDLIEDNRNEADISDWVQKHNRYARLQAREELLRLASTRPGDRGRFWGNPDERVQWLKMIWLRLPLYLRPCLYWTYRYVMRLGFLDGKQGFIFHFMQALWYRLLVDINRDELRQAGAAVSVTAVMPEDAAPPPASVPARER